MPFPQVLQQVVREGRFLWGSVSIPAELFLGGDSPWLRRILGISTCPQVGSLYNEGVWDNILGWVRAHIRRTLTSDLAHYTDFLKGGGEPGACGV